VFYATHNWRLTTAAWSAARHTTCTCEQHHAETFVQFPLIGRILRFDFAVPIGAFVRQKNPAAAPCSNIIDGKCQKNHDTVIGTRPEGCPTVEEREPVQEL
jgi:hypothetical protein